ncbi:uncharacterized protein LOC111944179 [Cyanistes caeruleus]|uniref:uncharacterized protein LOC111944179 n=1 Tax=Cyanistes caeruleus TaxID=156563 RepID=UPI000CDA4004|nr:uncharacterized protein LOC111944179 [Cyanistes caeruleus]
MLLQITYQEKGTQTDDVPETTTGDIYTILSKLSIQIDGMGRRLQNLEEASSQQHDYKNAELQKITSSQQHDLKNADLEGDVGKLQKTHNNVNIIDAGTIASSSSTTRSPTKPKNKNLNKLFEKPYTTIPKNPVTVQPQTTTYSESLNQTKKTYNHISRTYIENMYKLQTFLNLNPRSRNTTDPKRDYITSHLQRHNKLIALPGTNPNLVNTCYNYGLLSTVYTSTGEEIATMTELYKAFTTYKRITKGTFFYIKFYTAPAEILYDEIKPIIQVVKIGLTREMIIPEQIDIQPEIPKEEIPDFFANKRIIGLATILNELTNTFLTESPMWTYYSREQTMVYSHSKEIRGQDMENIRQWIISLLQPEEIPITRAIKKNFISENLLSRYCKMIGPRYQEHKCSKCNGEDNVIPEFNME